MVLPVKEGVLESAIREEARSNAGFLYLTADETIESIKNTYAESGDTGISSGAAGSVSRDQINSKLDSMSHSNEVEMIRDDTVYFFNPFKLPSDESHELFETLKSVFESKRYFTRRDLANHLRDADIYIADDDIGAFIAELRDRDLLAKLSGQTAYYRPGKELRENTELKGRSKIIKQAAGDDGCITHSSLENVLEIDQITSEIKADLTTDDVIYELENKYLVNSEECKVDFIDELVINKLSRPLRESFKSSDWVKTEGSFERNLRSNIKNNSRILSVVDDSSLFFEIKERVIDELSLTSEKEEIGGGHYTIYKIDSKFDEFADSEAKSIKNEVSTMINNQNPPSMQTALAGVEFPKYGADSTTESFIAENIRERTKELIDEDEEINIWRNK